MLLFFVLSSSLGCGGKSASLLDQGALNRMVCLWHRVKKYGHPVLLVEVEESSCEDVRESYEKYFSAGTTLRA